MNKAKLDRIVQSARALLEAAPLKTVYSPTDIAMLWSEIRPHENISQPKFYDVVVDHGLLQEAKFKSIYQNLPRRFLKRRFSTHELALSLYKASYLSHGTAAFLHDLTKHEPDMIYVNKEQSQKPAPDRNSLTQEALNNAFSGWQRTSRFVLSYKHARLTVLRGKHTDRLGVEALKVSEQNLDVTSVERTLIDITVRPAYCGGVAEVLKCYVSARKRISPDSLLRILRELDYVYPYHQAVGFYMQRAGFERGAWELLHDNLSYDFFLAYGIKNPIYDSAWRIYYPSDID